MSEHRGGRLAAEASDGEGGGDEEDIEAAVDMRERLCH
jgi:hypothetical protein